MRYPFVFLILLSFYGMSEALPILATPKNDKVLVHTNSSKPATDLFEKAKQFIGDLGARAINTLTSKEMAREEREDKFQVIFEEAFDLNAIAKFVLGRYRRIATEDEKKEFLDLFKKSMSVTYADRFSQYTNELFEITDAKNQNASAGLIRVYSFIKRPDAPNVKIDWHIYATKDGDFKIVDVFVEDISMSMTQRQDYSATIEREGGTVSGLNRALKEKVKNSHKPVDGLITSKSNNVAAGA